MGPPRRPLGARSVGHVRPFRSHSVANRNVFSQVADASATHRHQSVETIEWPRLCQYVAGFAQTTMGQRAVASSLLPPETERGALEMVRQTRAIQMMQEEYVAEVDFGGIQTVESEQALKRVNRGGMLNGLELLAVASLIKGSGKMQRKIRECAKQAENDGDRDGLRPIADVFEAFEVPGHVAVDIASKLEESKRAPATTCGGRRDG
jgi:dsDNA-specific endonuclease/ATPase MutS2